ncbi:DUF342 domain-containing protein [Caldicellulosiruptoraceae bacterium PP1]
MNLNNIKVDIKTMVTTDRMKAMVLLLQSENGVDLSAENVKQALSKNRIVYGIDEDAINRLIQNPVFDSPIVVANGKFPQKGIDSKIIYHFEIKKDLKPKELEDGRVDYKDLGIVQNVRKDDILATLVDAIDGQDGMDVLGIVLKAPKPRKLALPRGKNTYISDAGKTLKAACDGQVTFIEGKVTVLNTLEINSNVDISTGNINFVGNVHVHGSVLSGFKIFAEGNVEIEGIVEASEIEAKGDVILHKGITGMGKGKVTAGNNIFAKFIENAYVSAKNDIQAEAIVNSTVNCGNKLILIGRKASIVGGVCKVGKEVDAKVIGSLLSTTTEIEVGIDPLMLDRYHTIKKEIQELKENIKKCDQGIEVLKKLEAVNMLTDDKKEMLAKFTRSKIISNERLQSLTKEFEDIEKKLDERNEGIIKVSEVIYPGTKITIGTVCKYIKEEMKFCKFYRDEADIKVEPYK